MLVLGEVTVKPIKHPHKHKLPRLSLKPAYFLLYHYLIVLILEYLSIVAHLLILAHSTQPISRISLLFPILIQSRNFAYNFLQCILPIQPIDPQHRHKEPIHQGSPITEPPQITTHIHNSPVYFRQADILDS